VLTTYRRFRSSDRRTAVAALEKSGIVLVGEDNEFLRQGGMIALIMSAGKIAYEANEEALQRTGIRYGTGVHHLRRMVFPPTCGAQVLEC
jgi:hypothetical protein